MGETFTMSEGWLHWDKNPTSPHFELPAGAVDAHCHVFGPGGEFPFSPARKYTPCDASKAQLAQLHRQLGIERRVIVQATCHGTDNRAMVDAVQSFNGTARGIATVSPQISDAELNELHKAGVRGVRFNFLKRLVNTSPQEDLKRIAQKIAGLGWHIVLYFEAEDLPDLEQFFSTLPTALVIDHMGRPDVSRSMDGPEFSGFLRFVDNNDVWVKVSCPERLSIDGPPALAGQRAPYTDVIPFARKAIEEFGDVVLWGTDWPHPNLKSHMPDDGLLVDFIPSIATTREAQHQLLVANPMKLYWPDDDVPPLPTN